MLLTVNDIQVRFSGETVLDNVSIHVEEGEFIGLIGPNGAGKTTLLRVLLGLLSPTNGTVTRSKRSVGYVPQNTAIYSGSVPFSVREVVQLGSKGSKTDVKRSLEAVRMIEHAEKSFNNLSGGQKQRVVIAKALAADPDVLVLDEPTTGIDGHSKTEFFQLLRLLQSRGVAVIIVSHEIDFALELASRIIYLNQTVLYDGPTEQFNIHEYTSHA